MYLYVIPSLNVGRPFYLPARKLGSLGRNLAFYKCSYGPAAVHLTQVMLNGTVVKEGIKYVNARRRASRDASEYLVLL